MEETQHSECLMKEEWGELRATLEFIRQAMSEKMQRYEKHIEESSVFRQNVSEHTEKLKDLESFKQRVWTTAFSSISAIIALSIGWGAINNQVQTNTKRLDLIEHNHKVYEQK